MERTTRSNMASDKGTSKLANDLQALIRDAEELLDNTRSQVGGRYDSTRRRFASSLDTAKSGLTALEEEVLKNTRLMAESTGQYVQSHPWQSVGVGAALGLVCGLLIGRR